MGFYQRVVLPRLIDLAMRNSEVTPFRAKLVPQAHGTVVEIGVGSGLNLPYYRDSVRRVYAVDPSEELLRMARRKADESGVEIELLAHSGESLPLDSRCADAVVTTFTLCSVGDPDRALREALRVLKPDGVLLFAEHGLAPESSVQRWQHRLNPVWRKLAGGCNLDRRMDALIERAGFRITHLDTRYVRGPRPLTYVYSGRAVPA